MKVRLFGKKKYERSKIYFTIIELLMVISIIAVLACILFPALSSARSRARQIQCVSNLKQLGVYTSMYIGDFGWLYARRWSSANLGLTNSTNWNSYAFNLYIKPEKISSYGIGSLARGSHKRCDFACPSVDNNDPDFSATTPWTIGYNEGLHSLGSEAPKLKGPKYTNPSRLCLLADVKANTIASYDRLQFRHLNSINVLYVDLHAGGRKMSSMMNSAVSGHTPFWSDYSLWVTNPE